MIVLGIETATELVGVAVGDEDGVRAAAWATGRRRHAETLAPAITHVLELAGTELREIGAVAVDTGPGLFTWLRVGVATAKALAQGMGVGVIGVSSLAVLAHAAFEGGWPGTVAAVVDARREEVFWAAYRPGGGPGSPPEELSAPRVDRPRTLVEALSRPSDGPVSRRPSDGPVLAVGDGAVRYGDLLTGVEGLVLAGPSLAGPPPASAVALALHRILGGEVPGPPADVEPRYLRDADARANWAQRRPVPGGG